MKTMKKWKTNQIKCTNKRKWSNHNENKIQTLKKVKEKEKITDENTEYKQSLVKKNKNKKVK